MKDNGRKKRNFLLCLIITIGWTLFIWSMSLQNAEESSKLSGGIVDWLVNDVLASFDIEISNLEHIIRKMAHFTEYMILGCLAVFTAKNKSIDKRYRIYPWIYCISIAVIDENIQRFVPGRSGQISDMVLDSVGALCGAVIIEFMCNHKLQK